MLRYLRGGDLDDFPKLRDTMFKDRATQFKARLQWDVCVDKFGFEKDQYDTDDTIYVILENPDGSHAGSLRQMPTTAPCMLNDFFADLMEGKPICDPEIWEVSRFCIAPKAPRTTSVRLFAGSGELAMQLGLRNLVGVFDARMARIYKMIGIPPGKILATDQYGAETISIGLWDYEINPPQHVARRAQLCKEYTQFCFKRYFGQHGLAHIGTGALAG